MICPYYKNKEVFDGFNEMIEALGGRPMTEEEFRDSALRNQRTGRDFAAMEAAYTVYNRNNGNFLDKAPNGNKSVLFQSLLDINEGDRRKAIIQKSNVYSDAFFNWFGDWTSEDKENVSKVVDENGEPLVVWHHTDDKNLKEFKLDFINYFQKDGGTNKAFFFDENTHGTLNRKYDLPVYLNIKELSEYEGTKEDLHKQGTSYRAVVNKSAENNDTVGGVHMKNFDDNKLEHQSIWITHSPNQIKHVANLGTWSTTDNDINNIVVGEKGAASLDKLLEVNTRLNNLSVAKEMEAAGKKPLDIKIATGWEKGVDGKWRYEIPDVLLKMDKYGSYKIYEVVGNYKQSAAERPIEEVIDLSSLPENYREELEYVGYIKLYNDDTDGERGSYSIEDGKVIFSVNLYYDEANIESARSIIIHELLHFILEREGFQNGGNLFMSRDAYLKHHGLYDKYHNLIKVHGEGKTRTLMDILSKDDEYVTWEYISRKLDLVFDMIPEDASEDEIDSFIKEFIPEWEKGVNYSELMDKRRAELERQHREELEAAEQKSIEAYKELEEMEKNIPNSYESYRRLYGEAEARTASKRRNLSEEERRNSLFIEDLFKDVSEEDLIFLNNNPSLLASNTSQYTTNLNQFETASLSMFGTDIMSRLLNDGDVTTDELIDYLFSTRSVSLNNMLLADILRRHKISVTLDGRIGQFTLATTITNSAGLSVIALNPNLIDQVSRGYLCEAILHECVHAVTVDAINNPKNEIQKQFSELNNRVFNLLLKALPKNSALLNDIDLGLYALKNEKEFAAVFITNADARDTFYKIARGIDVLKNGYVLNTIKRFINSIAELFINKDLFNTNEALLNEYKSKFYNHLLNAETKTPIKLTKQQLHQIHDDIDIKTANTESLIDGIKYLENAADAIERNDIRIISIKRKNKDVDRVYSFDDITNKLTIRINALRTSDMERLEKTKYINDAQTQIEMFKNQQTSKYTAITSTLKQIVPNILKDVRELKNINMDPESSISANEFMYLMHSNIGMYRSIAETMLGLINLLATRQLILEEYNSGVPEDLKLKDSDIEELKGSIQDVKNLADEGIVVLNILRSRTAINILRQRALNSGYSEDMEKYIENITENPTYDDDINWFEKWLGPMDSAQNEVLRVLSNIVKGALDTADKKVINKTVDLLELQSKLKSGENVIDLYEKFDDGTTSGYIVRKLHYGKFYRNFDEELRRINKLFSKVLNKKLDDSLRTAPHNNDLLTDDQLKQLGLKDLVGEKISILLGWNELKNRWLSEHCERKYNKKYYDAWNRVPQVAKDALDSINAEISSLLSQDGVRGDDGYYHYDKLSGEDWDLFLNLTTLKKLLRSDYDMFGNKKQPGSLEYEIAHSLQELSINLSLISMEKKEPSRYKEVLALYKKYQQTLSEDDFAAVRNACYQTEISKNKEAWLKAVDNLIEECGGVESYNKWKAGENGHGFNVKKFKKWHLRNSRLEFKRDEEGNAIVFKDIEAAMLGFVVDYGSRYELLKNKERELLRPYKAQNGEVIASELPEAVKNLLLELYEEEYQIREQAKEDNPQLKELSKKYKEVFDLFIVFKDTEYYKQIMKQIKNSATDEDGNFDVSVYDALMENYGRYGDPDESGIVTEFVPYRWLLRMEAVDVDKYMEYEPNNAWSEKADDSSILNPNFDESENSAFVPKKELYDNSKLFNKINKGSKGIQDLYAAIVSTMEEANKMLANRTYADTYQLPGITGSLWKRIKNHGFVGACKVLGKCLLELLGLSRNPEDFSEAGTNLALDNIDSEGNVSNSISPIKGKYPDGRTFHILPQYYTRKMEDPSQISADLINIVVNYYRMACYYDEKVKIKDDCETLVDFLKEDRGTKISNRQFGENSKNSEYNAFKAGEKFLEMNLYNLKRSNTTFNLGPIQFLWSKLASSWKTWTTRRNLGLNPKVALTGFLTTMGVHIINSITGQNYGKEGAYAFVEVLRRVFQSALGARYLGNPLSNDDMMVMAEVFGIADQFEKKIEGTNNNRFVYAAYKNSIFGMLSTVDFWTKCMIMVATLMNHHYVNGRFLSKDDIRSSRYLYKTKKEFKKALDEWEKGDNLYHLLVSKNHRLTIDDKYKSAYEHDFDVIKNRIQKTAEYADGMATDLQRSAISQSVIGAFILIHRQYLPLIISRYYGKRVYDYDTRMYKNGIFRTLFDFICVVMLNNLLAGVGAGAFTGFAFGGPIGAVAGTLAAVGTRAYGQYRRNKSGEKSKKLKDIYNERFSDFSTERSTRNSYANRYAMKEISATVIGYHLLVVPIVNWVCSMAEDDDDDKWWLLLLAYAMRSFLWEFYTAFRTDDMLNNIKTPSAATSVLDAAEDVVYVASSSLASQTFLYDPSLTIDDWKHLFGTDEVVLRGAYEDWTKLERGLMKTWAGHNMYEQLMDSKTKRHWQENQVMRIRN